MFENYRDIMSAADVAEILHVSKAHIYDLLSNGELHGHREGRTWKIMKMSLIDYCVKKSSAPKDLYNTYR